MALIEDVMAMVWFFGDKANRDKYFDYPSDESTAALAEIRKTLEPIIADAQRYRSLQGKIDGND